MRRHYYWISRNLLEAKDMKIEPYLFFEGRCEEAIEFYKKAIGAELTALMRYREGPGQESHAPGMADKVMHANLRVGEATIMVSDGLCRGQMDFNGFSLCLQPAGEAEARRMFEALAQGGQIQMELAETFYSPLFGMVADRFGVSWMIMVLPPTSDK
jgi:PhnB protein